MEGAGHVGDDRTFRANYTIEGVARLQEIVKEKLKEFMGDYTDDTLVEYVIVLLKNGRLKEEAESELNVFLGNDSESFVTWLWDFLTQNLHLYVKFNETFFEEDNRKITTNDSFGLANAEMPLTGGYSHMDSEHDGEKLVHVSRNRRNREWKGLGEMTESFPLRSTVHDALHSKEKTSHRSDALRFSPPRPQGRKKRSREDERQPAKRDTDSHPKHAPSRRLLEFAVRDAVKPAHQLNCFVEPATKRLRSVVSTSMDTISFERPQRFRPVMKIPDLASAALRAAAKSAEDVIKSRNAGSVFDRLGHSIGIGESIDQSSIMKKSILQDIKEDEDFGQSSRIPLVKYNQKNVDDGDFTRNSSTGNGVADMDVDSMSDNEGYDDFGISSDHGFDSSQYAYSDEKKQSSLTLQYNASNNADAIAKKAKAVQLGVPPATSLKSSSKIVNISVNVNTWKPQIFQSSRSAKEIENQTADKNAQITLKPSSQISKVFTENDKEPASTDIKKDPIQKSQALTSGISFTTSRPSEDSESRTIFISNVHFAATKDTLSRHFNKFGEVLKVIIMTNPTSRQPIGSAYVEFLRKESAELALSLNGTSFMSRIMKVVRRNSAEAHVVGWPQIARGPPFTSRSGRMPFPRGILPGAFRARPLKPGARSLQWKRGAPATQNATGTSGSLPHAIAGRNLTYVRPEKT